MDRDPISPTTAAGAALATVGVYLSEHWLAIASHLLVFLGLYLDWRMRRAWKSEDRAAELAKRQATEARLAAIEAAQAAQPPMQFKENPANPANDFRPMASSTQYMSPYWPRS
jgi:hypothetical protein